MGKGLAFLNLKFFHPSNRENQERKFDALQKEALELKRQKERQLELQQEKELQEMRLKLIKSKAYKHSLNRSTRSGEKSTFNAKKEYERELAKSQVSFMYNEPPGLKKQLEKERKKIEEETHQRKWNDVLNSMTREERRVAEREMEQGLSIHERNVKRFECLKDAPMVNEYVKNLNIDVEHKPFGKTLKHVKCFKCNQWGHSIGDRECPLMQKHFTNVFKITDVPSRTDMRDGYEIGTDHNGELVKRVKKPRKRSKREADEDVNRKTSPQSQTRSDTREESLESASASAHNSHNSKHNTNKKNSKNDKNSENSENSKNSEDEIDYEKETKPNGLLKLSELAKIDRDDPLSRMRLHKKRRRIGIGMGMDERLRAADTNASTDDTRSLLTFGGFTGIGTHGGVDDAEQMGNQFEINTQILHRRFDRNQLVSDDNDSSEDTSDTEESDSNSEERQGEGHIRSILEKSKSKKEKKKKKKSKKHKNNIKSQLKSDENGDTTDEDSDNDEDVRFIKSLTGKQQADLLKRLMDGSDTEDKNKKRKKRHKKRKKHKRKHKDKRDKKKQKKKHKSKNKSKSKSKKNGKDKDKDKARKKESDKEGHKLKKEKDNTRDSLSSHTSSRDSSRDRRRRHRRRKTTRIDFERSRRPSRGPPSRSYSRLVKRYERSVSHSRTRARANEKRKEFSKRSRSRSKPRRKHRS